MRQQSEVTFLRNKTTTTHEISKVTHHVDKDAIQVVLKSLQLRTALNS
jgi:hypothetical protein